MIRVVHTSRFAFDEPIRGGRFEVRLRPRELETQHVSLHQLVLRPSCEGVEGQDRFANHVVRLSLERPTRRLEVHAISEVELLPPSTTADVSLGWEEVTAMGCRGDELREPAGELAEVREQALALGAPIFRRGRSLLRALDELEGELANGFSHLRDRTAASQPPKLSEVFTRRRGVCADLARVALATLRAQRLRGRYVGGYLVSALGAGQTTLCDPHAWVSVDAGGDRWLDVDFARHGERSLVPITVAWGSDAPDVSPLTGELLGGGHQSLEVKVWVTKLEE